MVMKGEYIILEGGKYTEIQSMDKEIVKDNKIVGVGEETYFHIKRMDSESLKSLENKLDGRTILYNLGSQLKTKAGVKVDVFMKISYEWVIEDIFNDVKTFVNQFMNIDSDKGYIVKGGI